ncbi:MAG: UDP-N-acetylmuramoyl-L-alanine--D-glutamate ligase [Pirellulales bacterium]|nr:UDP-N-acetylmuramoyl-L-alanine--D-glutamate ligase [Pirellulales bacterium]
MKRDYRNRRITVMGLGRFGGGAGAARWLARQGARVTVTDLAGAETLNDSLEKLRGVPIAEYRLGGHREEDFRGAEMVVVNPAVRPGNPLVEIARQAGAVITTELELFLNHCPAKRTIGVTGSNGKSTTAAMTAAVLRTAGGRVWLGGNFGGSLLENLPEMQNEDFVVLEISSFQLYYLSPQARLPLLAAITNCTPNHLDWHGSWQHYVAAKQKILTRQSGAMPTLAVGMCNTWDRLATCPTAWPRQRDHGTQRVALTLLNPFDPEVASWKPLIRGASCDPYPLDELPELALPGEHQQINAAMAAGIGRAFSCGREAIEDGLKKFRGLPGRLEEIAVFSGRRFYNDTAATTPQSTIAALNTLDTPVWLLAGGKNKGFDFQELAEAVGRFARGAAFFGSAREELQTAVRRFRPTFYSTACEHLADALAWCFACSKPGEAIVFSPACASTDQYRNFQDRGKEFHRLVNALTGSDGNDEKRRGCENGETGEGEQVPASALTSLDRQERRV